MSKRNVAALALVVACALVAVKWGVTPPAALEQQPEQAPAEPAAAAAPLDPLSTQPDAAAPETRRPEAAGGGVARSPSEAARVRGRCVAAESGAPLPGCALSFASPWKRNAWTPPPPVRSGPDGTFEMTFVRPQNLVFDAVAVVAAAGRATCELRIGLLEPGQVCDLGDLRLTVAREVRGRVEDERGEPVPGLQLALAGETRSLLAFTRAAQSGDDGAFAFAEPVPAGAWPLAVKRIRSPDEPRIDFVPLLVEPDRVVVRDVGPQSALVVKVVRGKPIRGSIFDDRGQGVRNAVIRAVAGPWLGQRVTSDHLGDFEIFPVLGAPAAVRLDVAPGALHERLRTTDELAWGTEDVRLTVERVGIVTVPVDVVEAGTGAPVRSFSVRIVPEETHGFDLGVTATSEDGSGRAVVAGVRPGRSQAQVSVSDGSFVAADPVSFLARDAMPPLWIELQRAVAVPVQVVTASGKPRAGASVVLLAPGGAVDVRSPADSSSPTEASRRDSDLLARVLDRKTTQAGGLATLHCPPNLGALSIRAAIPGAGSMQLDGVAAVARTAPLVLVVPQGATLTGTLRPPAAAAKASLCLRKPGERPSLNPDSSSFTWPVPPGGAFKVTGLPAGTWEVVLATDDAWHDASLATVQLFDGQTTQLDLDAAAFAPGRIRGRVLLCGAPPPSGELLLAGEVAKGSWIRRRLTTDAAGEFAADELPPGRYQVKFLSSGAGVVQNATCAGSLETCTLASGGEAEQTFHLESRRLEVRLLGGDGRPLARQTCFAATVPQLCLFRFSDDDGRFTVDHAPGLVQIWVQPEQTREGRYVGEVTLERAHQSVELTVPSAAVMKR